MILVGDIHGQIRLMENVLKCFKENKILFVGDIIDRGDAKSCLELLSESGLNSLIGNHEQMAIAFSNAPKMMVKSYYNIWMANGGKDTLSSLSIKGSDMEYIQKSLKEDRIFGIINDFSIYKIVNDVMAVHAGIDSAYRFDSTESFLWSRTSIDDIKDDVALSFKNDFPNVKFMITGHNIVSVPTIYINYSILQLRIDLGSFYSKSVGAFDTESGNFYKITESDQLLLGNIRDRTKATQ